MQCHDARTLPWLSLLEHCHDPTCKNTAMTQHARTLPWPNMQEHCHDPTCKNTAMTQPARTMPWLSLLEQCYDSTCRSNAMSQQCLPETMSQNNAMTLSMKSSEIWSQVLAACLIHQPWNDKTKSDNQSITGGSHNQKMTWPSDMSCLPCRMLWILAPPLTVAQTSHCLLINPAMTDHINIITADTKQQ